MTPYEEHKYQVRKERNREAAKRLREKRLRQIRELTDKNRQLLEEKQMLEKQFQRLMGHCSQLEKQIQSLNCTATSTTRTPMRPSSLDLTCNAGFMNDSLNFLLESHSMEAFTANQDLMTSLPTPTLFNSKQKN